MTFLTIRASSRVSLVLDLEGSARKGRTASSSKTNPRFDSNHEPREPDLGRTPDPQRADEVGHQDLGGFDCEVHGPKPQTPIADVANVPQESRFSTRVRRLLHRPHRLVRSPLRFYCPHIRSTTRRALQRHSSSNGGMDGAANPRSLSF